MIQLHSLYSNRLLPTYKPRIRFGSPKVAHVTVHINNCQANSLQLLEIGICLSPEINDVKVYIWVHVNVSAGLVDGPTIRRLIVGMEPTPLTVSNN